MQKTRRVSAWKHRETYLGNVDPIFTNVIGDHTYRGIFPDLSRKNDIMPSCFCFLPYHVEPAFFYLIPAVCKWNVNTVTYYAREREGRTWEATFELIDIITKVTRSVDIERPFYHESLDDLYQVGIVSNNMGTSGWQSQSQAGLFCSLPFSWGIANFSYVGRRIGAPSTVLTSVIGYCPLGQMNLRAVKYNFLGAFIGFEDYTTQEAIEWEEWSIRQLGCDLPLLPI